MKKLIFATTNKKKISEARSVLLLKGIEFFPVDIEVDEIQSLEPKAISVRKAKDIYAKLIENGETDFDLIVHDSSWNIPALNGFPGGYMKDVLTWFGVDDFLSLMMNKDDRTAIATDNIIFYDGNQETVFTHEINCVVLSEARGDDLSSWEKVCSSDGGKNSISENHEKGFVPDEKLKKEWFAHWISLADWYESRNNAN